MYRWSIETKQLPLKFTWKISRGESTEKTLFFIKVSKGEFEAMGEVAGITTEQNKVNELYRDLQKLLKNPPQSQAEISELSLPSHLAFGVSSALTHIKALELGMSVSQFLEVETNLPIQTSFSLPILAPEEVKKFFEEYNLGRFSVLKIKISKDVSVESCKALSELYQGPIRIDANEAFSNVTEALNFMEQIKTLNIEFVEQPLPRDQWEDYKELKKKSPLPLFADESVQNGPLPNNIEEYFDGINVKMMKAGSYKMALQQIQQAHDKGLQVMLGCMVESSLGIASALAISEKVDYFDLDGFLYFKEEPFKIITENNGKLTYSPSHPYFV